MERNYFYKGERYHTKDELAKAVGCSKRTLRNIIAKCSLNNYVIDESSAKVIEKEFENIKENMNTYFYKGIYYTNVDDLLKEMGVRDRKYREWKTAGHELKELETKEGIENLLNYKNA